MSAPLALHDPILNVTFGLSNSLGDGRKASREQKAGFCEEVVQPRRIADDLLHCLGIVVTITNPLGFGHDQTVLSAWKPTQNLVDGFKVAKFGIQLVVRGRLEKELLLLVVYLIKGLSITTFRTYRLHGNRHTVDCRTKERHFFVGERGNYRRLAGTSPGDKELVGRLSLVGPSVPSVTREVLSPVRGNIIAGWRLLSMGGLDSWVKQNPVPISAVRLDLLCGHATNQLGSAAAMQYGGEDAPSPWNAPSSHQKWSWKRAVVVTGRLRVVGTESALYDRLGEFRVAVSWEFTPGDVIEFLRDHLRRKTPAWKHLKIIQSLICYRRIPRPLRLMT
ncbi:hypothetical protein Poly21_13860 [Allorhodopirellula heiligendammensis]|uniref:Uncharacterized protein n=1 Tax=Allorhodopirellula heiligendammensis TaxID=2714739 RepID=A0A5C6C544_9BACT|nr:hypothetical protein Poly21_13860 [Allorhodopirellula heiligendammensis]